jgi:hypothetical protein
MFLLGFCKNTPKTVLLSNCKYKAPLKNLIWYLINIQSFILIFKSRFIFPLEKLFSHEWCNSFKSLRISLLHIKLPDWKKSTYAFIKTTPVWLNFFQMFVQSQCYISITSAITKGLPPENEMFIILEHSVSFLVFLFFVVLYRKVFMWDFLVCKRFFLWLKNKIIIDFTGLNFIQFEHLFLELFFI